MKLSKKTKSDLNKKFRKVLATPASFDLFVAIHDFIQCIEASSPLLSGLSDRIKINRELDVANKYGYLKKIYQGLEDIDKKSSNDLGHERYAVILELSRIQNKETSESNSFWKRRELSRKLATIIYERLNAQPSVEA
jgi:hypothetical protein